MRAKLIILLLGCCICYAWGQKEPAKFGEVSMEELKMQVYPADSSADAIVLFDRGEVTVDPHSTSGTTLKRHIRIKIFRKKAFKDWGDVTVLSMRGRFSKLKAATYNLVNNSISKYELEDTLVFKKRYDKFTDEISFALPSLQEGSVIEYTYTATDYDITLPTWTFQHVIPTIWSEYSLNILNPNFTADLTGELKITKHESKYDGKYQRWIITNLPAFKSEPLMPHADVYKSSIRFRSARNSWMKMNTDLMKREDFGGIIEGAKYLKKDVEQILQGAVDPREKIDKICTFIKQNIKWNGTRDCLSQEPSKTMEEKKGTSADINLLLASMLKKAGIKVNMVLISTRDHGFVMEDFPSMRQFNYVLCLASIDSTVILLDATEKFLPNNIIPDRCLNHKGLLISELIYDWVNIFPSHRIKTSVNANLIFGDDGELKGKLEYMKYGYSAFDARVKYDRLGEEEYKKDFLGDKFEFADHSEIKNMTDISKPVVESYDMRMEGHTTHAGDFIYINPYVAMQEESNPFVYEERVYPIDFGNLVEKVFVCNITIPDDYVVEELPGSKILAMPDDVIKSTFNISSTGNRITVMSRLMINKTMFASEEYAGLREFYNRLIAKKSERIVLKKKSKN